MIRLYFIVIVFFLGCKETTESAQSGDSTNKVDRKVNDSISDARYKDVSILSDSTNYTEYEETYVERLPFDTLEKPDYLYRKFNLSVLDKYPIKNEHTNDTDTIYIIGNNRNKFKYIYGDKVLLLEFNITDDAIALDNGVKIGMSKREVLKRFAYSDISNASRKIALLTESEFFSMLLDFDSKDKLLQIQLTSSITY